MDIKIFNDPVHGTIQLHSVLVKIIDTPEFQRLRNIKQLGATYYVFPGAQHNRFEHSIGTAHLAGKLVRHLMKQEDLNISEKDVLCVEIAGLCHDLGHGPFSHLFDGMFVKVLDKECKWTHEKGSCDFFQRIMDRKVESGETISTAIGLDQNDVIFIKEMIYGPLDEQSGEDQETSNWPYRGRTSSKSFLYEIISNKKSGVDVDKWDYFARDCHHLGIANGFDHDRFIQFTKVIADENGQKRICVRDKEVFNLYEMFHTRFALHKRAYQHKGVNAVEHMICDAMVAANDCVKILGNGKNGGCKISECIREENLGSFLNLDDSVLQKILLWEEDANTSHREGLAIAKFILKRLANGERYKCVGNKILSRNLWGLTGGEIKDEIASGNTELRKHLKVSIIKFNYGCGDKDPIQNYRFYIKNDPEPKAINIPKEEVSFLLPDIFEEKVVQVFCTSQKDNLITDAKNAFAKWYKKPEPSTNTLLQRILETSKQHNATGTTIEKMVTEIRDSLCAKSSVLLPNGKLHRKLPPQAQK